MRRASRLVAVVAALVCAGTAEAHVTLAPPFVDADEATRVAFETPNERRGHRTTELEVDAPPGIEFATADAPAGWSLDLIGSRARWTGGAIRALDIVSFPLVVTARIRPGTTTFTAAQRYDDGQVVRWSATLTVLPPRAEDTPPQHLRRALAAGAVGIVVIAGSFLALRRARKGPLQEK